MVVSRTAISELAKGNFELEAKGVGLLMSMVGYGMLISPALGGLLSEPLRQYPSLVENNGNGILKDQSFVFSLLSKYPFLLPNIVSFILSMLSMIFVIVAVEETLPKEKRRHWSYVGTDFIKWILRTIRRILLCFCCCNNFV